MKSKKLIITLTIFIAVIAACILPSLAISAETGAVFTVETSATAVAGQSFTVEVTLSQNPGFSGAYLELSYSQKYFTIEKVEISPMLDDNYIVAQPSEDITELPLKISVASDSDTFFNGVLFTVTFKLSNDATLGDYPIEIECKQLFDSDGYIVPSTCVNGGVSIDCNHNYVKTVVSPKCNAKGYTFYECTECQRHYQDDWVDELPHSWKTLSSTKPTCTEDGKLKRKCTVCSTEETITNGTATDHSFGKGEVIAPTCSDEGYTLHKCKNCTYEYRDEYTPVSDHVYEEKVTQEPSCSHVGYKKLTCIHCDNSLTVEIAKTDCKFEVSAKKEPTHTAQGWTAYVCSGCGATKKDDYKDKTPYQIELRVITPATCTENGNGVNICTDGCGFEEETVIPALGHTFGEWVIEVKPTDKIQGLKTRICTVCSLKESETLPIEHKQEIPSDSATVGLLDKFFALKTQTKLIILISAALVLAIVLFCTLMLGRINAASGKKKKKRTYSKKTPK